MTVPGPYGPPPRPPRPPFRPVRRQSGIPLRPGVIIATVFVLVVAGAGVGIFLLFATGRAVAAEVVTEPVASAGANPFMPPVGMDQPNVVSPAASQGTFAGNTPGLYGGTRNNSTCDQAAMVAFLEANPDKAAAWAGVIGIQVSSIPGYVAELTPVILRSDTYVTNHGFSGGRATTLTSVLQAGTAVLVDKFGTPRTKCFCGNPLTPPTVPTSPKFVGTSWPQFSETRITVIQQTTVRITNFTLVNPETNEVFERPIGSSGLEDRLVTAGGGATATAGPTATPTREPPATRRSTGSHVLIQEDQPNCNFSDAPRITGSITMTVEPDGSLVGSMAGRGSGSRPLRCGATTATMNWDQDYTVSFDGRVTNGRLTASGTLSNVNGTTLTNCAEGGQPISCPFYEGGAGTLSIDFTGSYDPATGRGEGSFTVDVGRPTAGTWSVQ